MTMTDPGAELALRAQPVLPMRPEEARAVLQAYEEMCRSILSADDVQDSGDGRQFTKRSGFQKLAAAYGVSTEIINSMTLDVTRDGETVLVSRVVARAVHPSGRHADGDGVCASNEKRFRKGDQRMEHNLQATATTRAVNRAVSNLIAFGSVSAEEAEETGTAAPAAKLPDWAQPMRDIAGVANNLTKLLQAAGVNQPAVDANRIGQEIFTLCDETFPFALARLAHLLAGAADAPMGTPGVTYAGGHSGTGTPPPGQMTADAIRADAKSPETGQTIPEVFDVDPSDRHIKEAAVDATATEDTTTTEDTP